jgi:hypothetical protein
VQRDRHGDRRAGAGAGEGGNKRGEALCGAAQRNMRGVQRREAAVVVLVSVRSEAADVARAAATSEPAGWPWQTWREPRGLIVICFLTWDVVHADSQRAEQPRAREGGVVVGLVRGAGWEEVWDQ